MAEQEGIKTPPGRADIVQAGRQVNQNWLEWFANIRVWMRRVNIIREDNVASPPTDTELDTAFGTPEAAGDGFIGILDDNGAGTSVYLCVARNSEWWYATLTKAV